MTWSFNNRKDGKRWTNLFLILVLVQNKHLSRNVKCNINSNLKCISLIPKHIDLCFIFNCLFTSTWCPSNGLLFDWNVTSLSYGSLIYSLYNICLWIFLFYKIVYDAVSSPTHDSRKLMTSWIFSGKYFFFISSLYELLYINIITKENIKNSWVANKSRNKKVNTESIYQKQRLIKYKVINSFKNLLND